MSSITRPILYAVDLSAPIAVYNGPELYATGDGDTAAVIVSVSDGGQAADLTGAASAGYFTRADGVTVVCPGSVSGGVITVTLTAECFAAEGACCLCVKLGGDDGERTLLFSYGAVKRAATDLVVNTPAVVTDLALLRAEIDARIREPQAEGLPGCVLTTDGEGGRTWEDPAASTVAGSVQVDGTAYTLRTGTGGAAGYLTFVLEAEA